ARSLPLYVKSVSYIAWSTRDAVGSNARPGSVVLIVNELSTTSVGDAVGAVAPSAASTDAATRAAASDAISAACRVRSLFAAQAHLSGGRDGCRAYDAIGRQYRLQVGSDRRVTPPWSPRAAASRPPSGRRRASRAAAPRRRSARTHTGSGDGSGSH